MNLQSMAMSWLRKMPVVLGLICFAAVIWFAGPLLAISDWRPLDPVWLRLTIIAVAVLLYPLGILAGPMSASKFVAYCAPSQAIAFASRSSLAALPAIVESAERGGLSPTAARVVLPLAVAVFHFGAAVAKTVGVIFLARLFGVALTPPQLATVIVAVVLASFAVPGIPGGSIIAMVPVLAAAKRRTETGATRPRTHGRGAKGRSPSWYTLQGRADAFAVVLGAKQVQAEHLLVALLWQPNGFHARGGGRSPLANSERSSRM